MSFCAESTAICLIDFTSPADAVRHDRMVALVERTAEGVDLQKSSRPRGRRMLRPCCNATPKADALVHELYGLTAEEIAVVEGK